jgi:molybdopterin-binding protein
MEMNDMQLSTRNQLKGKIKDIKKGPVSTEVILEVNANTDVVASITTGSADSMNLKAGDDVSALIKASSVIIMK